MFLYLCVKLTRTTDMCGKVLLALHEVKYMHQLFIYDS